jgi:predicted regulator of Ras-like GTPase activity (Roadblock/LC7/MglB family)
MRGSPASIAKPRKSAPAPREKSERKADTPGMVAVTLRAMQEASGWEEGARAVNRLVRELRGCTGAVLTAKDGEPVLVAAADGVDLFDVKVAGAQFAAALNELRKTTAHLGIGAPVEMRMRCAEGGWLAHEIIEGYFLFVVMRAAAPSLAARVLAEAAADLKHHL